MKIEKPKNLKVTKKVDKEKVESKSKKDKKDIKWFKKPLPIAGFVLLSLVTSLLIARPKIIQGELNWDYILNKIEEHDKKLTDLENKQDTTQTQTDQNTTDIQDTQAQVNNIQQQTTQNTSDIKNIQNPPPLVPSDPNLNSWTNGHGTFVFKDLGTKLPLYIGKNIPLPRSTDQYPGSAIMFRYDLMGPISEFANCLYTYGLPVGTQLSNIPDQWEHDNFYSNTYSYDAKNYFNQTCGGSINFAWVMINFSNDPNSPVFPGKFDIWW